MHGLRNMFYFERKKAFMQYFYCISSWVFVCRNVHFFLCRFLNCFFEKALGNFFVTKCSILDVAGILDPPQYAPTWIAYTNNLIQVLDER